MLPLSDNKPPKGQQVMEWLLQIAEGTWGEHASILAAIKTRDGALIARAIEAAAGRSGLAGAAQMSQVLRTAR